MTQHRTEENKQAFLTALQATAGNITESCKRIRISRQAFYDWRSSDTDFSDKVDEVMDGLIDTAESQLMKNILSGKEASLFFFLTNKRPDKWKQKGLADVQIGDRTQINNFSPELVIRMLKDKYGDNAPNVARQLATVLGISLEVRPSQNGSREPVRALPG